MTCGHNSGRGGAQPRLRLSLVGRYDLVEEIGDVREGRRTSASISAGFTGSPSISRRDACPLVCPRFTGPCGTHANPYKPRQIRRRPFDRWAAIPIVSRFPSRTTERPCCLFSFRHIRFGSFPFGRDQSGRRGKLRFDTAISSPIINYNCVF